MSESSLGIEFQIQLCNAGNGVCDSSDDRNGRGAIPPQRERHVHGTCRLIPAPVKPCDDGNNPDIGESPWSGSSDATHMESSRDQTIMSVARGL